MGHPPTRSLQAAKELGGHVLGSTRAAVLEDWMPSISLPQQVTKVSLMGTGSEGGGPGVELLRYKQW